MVGARPALGRGGREPRCRHGPALPGDRGGALRVPGRPAPLRGGHDLPAGAEGRRSLGSALCPAPGEVAPAHQLRDAPVPGPPRHADGLCRRLGADERQAGVRAADEEGSVESEGRGLHRRRRVSGHDAAAQLRPRHRGVERRGQRPPHPLRGLLSAAADPLLSRVPAVRTVERAPL